MLTILGLIGLVIILWLLCLITKEDIFIVFGIFFFIVLLGALCYLGSNHLDTHAKIKEFLAIKRTVEIARQNPNISPLEIAALQQKIIEANKWLANNKYYAKNPWTSWFIPGEVLKLRPIR